MKKNILLILTGGTIVQSNKDGMLLIDEKAKNPNILDKINNNKEKLNLNKIDLSNLFKLDSSNITPVYWNKIIEEIKNNYDFYDAFIVLHGTDTLSYTCSAISYAMSNINKPIIFTGSQVPFDSIGSDAEMNIENAIRIATQEEIELKGVICVFASHIICGTRVKKVDEFNYDAFENFNNDDLGRIGCKIHFNYPQIEKHNSKYGNAKSSKDLIILQNFAMDKIVVLNEFPGLNKNYIENLIDLGVKGIVFRTYAGGNSNVGDENDSFENLRTLYKYLLAKKIPITVISQPPKGNTTMSDYKPGIIAKSLGAIPAHDMSTEALTVKLGWLIGQNLSYEEIKSKLEENVRGEINL